MPNPLDTMTGHLTGDTFTGECTVTINGPGCGLPPVNPKRIHSIAQVTTGWTPSDMYGDALQPPAERAYNRGVQWTETPTGFTWDQQQLADVINAQLPENYAGLWSVDIEGSAASALYDPSNPKHQPALHMYIEVAAFARSLRPDVILGFYAMPGSPYWDLTTEEGRQGYLDSQIGVQMLIDTEYVDCVLPSLYDPYTDAQGNPDHEVMAFVTATAVAMSKGKPVWPFIADRYWGSMSTEFMLLTDAEIQGNVEAIMNAGASGVTMWAADPYYYQGSFRKNDNGTWQNTGEKWDRKRDVFNATMPRNHTLADAMSFAVGFATRQANLCRIAFTNSANHPGTVVDENTDGILARHD